MTNGEKLYIVYGTVTDFKNFQGNLMPAWKDLPELIQQAWEAVAEAKLNIPLEGRELSQIWHALDYAKRHKEAGIPGHGHFLLIAKLAKALGYIYD